MKATAILLLLIALFAVSFAHKELPEWARGGKIYKEKYGKLSAGQQDIFTALTWDAPIDHFNNNNNGTFKQR